jgi:hypothetical protein
MRRRTLQRWYPLNFNDVVGNEDLVEYGRHLVRCFRCGGQFNGDHAAITGKSRSGKSSLLGLVKRALTCDDFDFETLTPCNFSCSQCHQTPAILGNSGWYHRPKIQAQATISPEMNVRTVDCSSLKANDLEELLDDVRRHTGNADYYLVHLEEFHWLAEKGFDQRLLAPMDEMDRVTWIATSAYVKKEDAKVRRQLDKMLLNRFPYRISTQFPTVDDLAIWGAERCVEFSIKVEPPPESTLRRSRSRPRPYQGFRGAGGGR